MTEHRLHPFAALRVLRKTLVLYLVPLLRVLFERNWAALRAALWPDWAYCFSALVSCSRVLPAALNISNCSGSPAMACGH